MRRVPLSLLFLMIVSSRVFAADLASEVIYKSADRKAAAFVPLAVIERGLEIAPMAPEDRAYLRYRIDSAKAGECSEAIAAHHGAVRDEERRTLPQLMAESKGLFVGEVEAVVTGWSTSYNNAVTVVWVSPVSILKNADGRLNGDRFAFIIADAEMRIGDKRLCNTSTPFNIPATGDRLLVNAGPRVGDGRLFYGAHYFPMRDGQIQPAPFLDVRPFKSISLESAKVEAARLSREVQ